MVHHDCYSDSDDSDGSIPVEVFPGTRPPPPGPETVCHRCHNQNPARPSPSSVPHRILEYFSHKPTFKVYCKAEPTYYLTIRNGKVVLATSDPADQYQHWYMDDKYGRGRRDLYGYPSFALVNKATGQAIKHANRNTQPVQLIPYNPDYLDESLLWSLADELGGGYKAIRMTSNITLNLEALHGEKGVYHGIPVGLLTWDFRDSQQWRITPHLSNHCGSAYGLDFSSMRAHKVFCRTDANYSLSIRDGKVILAPADPSDQFQSWYKDDRYGKHRKDASGFSSFALVNKATGQAIKHSIGNNQPVQLVPYDPNIDDESLLWSLANELGGGYKAIRMTSNITLNLDAFHGNNGLYDGSLVGLFTWNEGDNQQWRITPV